MRLVLVRHPAMRAAGLCYGQIDVPLANPAARDARRADPAAGWHALDQIGAQSLSQTAAHRLPNFQDALEETECGLGSLGQVNSTSTRSA